MVVFLIPFISSKIRVQAASSLIQYCTLSANVISQANKLLTHNTKKYFLIRFLVLIAEYSVLQLLHSEWPSLLIQSSFQDLVEMMKPSSQTRNTSFTLNSDDFPALPGSTSSSSSTSAESGGYGGQWSDHIFQLKENPSAQLGIVTSPDGKMSNIPASMVKDQFGMAGLLSFIRVAETEPNLVSLALGYDMTALGLNLSSTESLYPSFGGPWAEGPVGAENINFPVPQEYNISDQARDGQEFAASVRDKLSTLKMNLYKDELLFYIFYTYTGDALQILAAGELYNRDWRYHKEEKCWISRRDPFDQVVEKGQHFERGTYYFFDPISWRKVTKFFYLEYEKLEERPVVPSCQAI